MAYFKKTWVDNELITTAAMNNIENGIEDVNDKIPKTLSQLVNDSSFMTYQDFIDNMNEYSVEQVSNIPTKTSDLTNDSGFITEEDIAERFDAIPTHISQLINDSEFVTKSFMLSQFDQLNSRIAELEQIVNEMNSKVDCTNISLDKQTITFSSLMATHTLAAQVTPTDTTDIISWKSNNTSVAVVDQNGKVTSVGDGSCVITVACGSRSATCTVTVAEVRPCTNLSLGKTSISFTALEKTHTLTYTVTPNNTTDTISWKSSNTSVATVNNSGVVTSKAAGTATITATCGGKSATCSVKVTVACTSISLNKTLLNFDGVGGSQTLTVSKSPSNTTDTVSWSTSNASVATVSNGVVTARGDGSCTITVTCGSKSATCSVKVITRVNYATMVLNPNRLTIPVGSSKSFTVTLNPTNTTIDVNSITVNASKDSISFTTTRVSQTELKVNVTLHRNEVAAVNLILGNQSEAVHIYVG
jgi:uncharacterized protein YjdB